MNDFDSSYTRRCFLRRASSIGVALALPVLPVRTHLAQGLPADLTGMTASQLSAAIRARQVRCVDVMQEYLQRIHRYNPVYNAIVSMLDDDTLMAEAARADRDLERGEYRGWMHGMPHAVKDLANAEGLETSFGSRIYAGTIAEGDDLHVARMRAAGAIFIGKTNVPEFGMGSQTYNEVHGTTRNAYDSQLTAGGSSGGAATGMATQMLPIADGGDMMGSLRNPAAFNNVIGFRPSQGRVPFTPSDVFYSQLPTNGPMGRDVEDTIRLLGTMAGHDASAPLSMRDDLPAFEAYRATRLEGLRIGWMGDYDGYLATERGVLELCERALADLEPHGVVIEDTLPAYDMAGLWRTWLTLRHWSQTSRQPLLENPETRSLLKPELIWEIEGSLNVSAGEISEAAVSRADWYRALQVLFERFDLLALPTAQVFPFPAETHWPSSISDRTMDTYHRWMEVVIGGTLAGVPVVNLPAGFDDRGRPMGMQFMGPMGQDRQVLEFGMAYEAVTDYLDRRPVLTDSA